MPLSTATSPGQIHIQPLRLLRFRPALLRLILLIAALLAAAAVIALAAPVKQRSLAALPAIIGLLLLRRVPSKFAMDRFRFSQGMLLPGIVLSSPPARIAILADLGKGDGLRYDVLAVRTYAASMFAPGLKPGDRVPLCAVYLPGSAPQASHWMSFLPEPVQSATADAGAASDALARIPAEEWAATDAAMQANPALKPGATIRIDAVAATGVPSGWRSVGTDMSDGKAAA